MGSVNQPIDVKDEPVDVEPTNVEVGHITVEPVVAETTATDPIQFPTTDDKTYKCGKCDLSFGQQKELDDHERGSHQTDGNGMRHKCHKCEASFVNKRSIQAHIIRIHSDVEMEKLHVCHECESAFSEKYELTSHMMVHSDVRPFACTYEKCVRRFKRSYNLKLHMDMHIGRKRFPCLHCDYKTNRKTRLAQHLSQHHSEVAGMPKEYQCEACDKSFVRRITYVQHLRTHTGEQPFPCREPGCDRMFSEKGNMEKHHKSWHQSDETTRVHPCGHCNKLFKSSCDAQAHTKRMHNILRKRSFQCDTCKKSFFTRSALVEHGMVHSNDRPFPCTVDGCETTFNRRGDVPRHVHATHQCVKPYQCSQCDHRTSTWSNLKRHEQSMHRTGPRPTPQLTFECTQCEKVYSTKAILSRHIRQMHTDVKDFECLRCGHRAANAGALKDHSYTHTGEKLHNCSKCDNSFALKSGLISHERSVHLDERLSRSHECSECGKRFKSAGKLDCHTKCVHMQLRPFQCDQCDKSFHLNGHLHGHIANRHSDDRPYACSIGGCTMTFKLRGTLQCHIKEIHLGIKRLKCNLCDYGTSRATTLKRHEVDCRKKSSE